MWELPLAVGLQMQHFAYRTEGVATVKPLPPEAPEELQAAFDCLLGTELPPPPLHAPEPSSLLDFA